jgi:cysteine synthase B
VAKLKGNIFSKKFRAPPCGAFLINGNMITDELKGTTLLEEKLKLIRSGIGDTPLHHFSKVLSKPGVSLYGKKEWRQLGGSVKARAAYFIFRSAIEKGLLNEDRILLDATSGNTGIAYASIGKELGIQVTLCMPENASAERKEILESLGANLILTSRFEGTDGAQEEAKRMADADPDKYFYADQYKNENNWKAHYFTTAEEIIASVPDITHFVAGLGTSGTFTGTGRRLKEINPEIRIISLQPDSAMHALEGWKHMETAVVPRIYDPSLADENLEVSTEEAYETLKTTLKLEGLLLSPSSAANLAGALKLADKINTGTIVTVLPDNADKYGDVIRKLL